MEYISPDFNIVEFDFMSSMGKSNELPGRPIKPSK